MMPITYVGLHILAHALHKSETVCGQAQQLRRHRIHDGASAPTDGDGGIGRGLVLASNGYQPEEEIAAEPASTRNHCRGSAHWVAGVPERSLEVSVVVIGNV